MSYLQTLQIGNSNSAATSTVAEAERVFTCPSEIVWARSDWSSPVGVLHSVNSTKVTSTVRGLSFVWVRVHVPKLLLGHRAAILLLQGMPLSRILLPNGEFRIADSETRVGVGHVVLRVDPWEYWHSRPHLTGLVLASLGELPVELSTADVLGALAVDSSA